MSAVPPSSLVPLVVPEATTNPLPTDQVVLATGAPNPQSQPSPTNSLIPASSTAPTGVDVESSRGVAITSLAANQITHTVKAEALKDPFYFQLQYGNYVRWITPSDVDQQKIQGIMNELRTRYSELDSVDLFEKKGKKKDGTELSDNIESEINELRTILNLEMKVNDSTGSTAIQWPIYHEDARGNMVGGLSSQCPSTMEYFKTWDREKVLQHFPIRKPDEKKRLFQVGILKQFIMQSYDHIDKMIEEINQDASKSVDDKKKLIQELENLKAEIQSYLLFTMNYALLRGNEAPNSSDIDAEITEIEKVISLQKDTIFTEKLLKWDFSDDKTPSFDEKDFARDLALFPISESKTYRSMCKHLEVPVKKDPPGFALIQLIRHINDSNSNQVVEAFFKHPHMTDMMSKWTTEMSDSYRQFVTDFSDRVKKLCDMQDFKDLPEDDVDIKKFDQFFDSVTAQAALATPAPAPP